jgi:hypothetical protein
LICVKVSTAPTWTPRVLASLIEVLFVAASLARRVAIPPSNCELVASAGGFAVLMLVLPLAIRLIYSNWPPLAKNP